MKDYLIIPDMHYPFQHPDSLDIIRDAIKYYQPHEILFTGDIVDQYFASLFKKAPYAKNANDEFKDTLKELKKLYKVLGDIPVKIVYGNHDLRYLKRAFEANLPANLMIDFKAMIEAPDTFKIKDSYQFDHIHLFHGEGFSGNSVGINLIKHFNMNVIMGHLHSQFAITYHNNGQRQLWSMICGCLIDVDSYAFEYGKTCKDKPVCGLGAIKDDTPLLIPV